MAHCFLKALVSDLRLQLVAGIVDAGFCHSLREFLSAFALSQRGDFPGDVGCFEDGRSRHHHVCAGFA